MWSLQSPRILEKLSLKASGLLLILLRRCLGKTVNLNLEGPGLQKMLTGCAWAPGLPWGRRRISQDLFVNHSVETHSLLCWRPKGFSAVLRIKWHWKHPQDLWLESELYLWFQRVVIHQCCWANSLLLPEEAEMRLWGPEFHKRRSLFPQQGQIVLSFYSHHNSWRKKVRPSLFSSRSIFSINLFGSCPQICWLLPTSSDSSLIIFPIVVFIFIISHNVCISWRFHAMFSFSCCFMILC